MLMDQNQNPGSTVPSEPATTPVAQAPAPDAVITPQVPTTEPMTPPVAEPTAVPITEPVMPTPEPAAAPEVPVAPQVPEPTVSEMPVAPQVPEVTPTVPATPAPDVVQPEPTTPTASATPVAEAAAPAAGVQDIVEVATGAGMFKTLLLAVGTAGLVDTLKGAGPFTVFAPTDAAFSKIPKQTLDALMADHTKLSSILTYHVVAGKVMAADMKTNPSAKTVQGQSLVFKTDAGEMTVDNAHVVATDIMANNGIIHVVDTVLMPK